MGWNHQPGFVCMLKLSGRHSRHSTIQQTSPTFEDEKRLNALETGDPPKCHITQETSIFPEMVVNNPWTIRPPISWGAFRGSIACQEGGMKSLTKGISRLDLIAWPPVDCIFQDCTFLGGFKSCHTVQIPKLIFCSCFMNLLYNFMIPEMGFKFRCTDQKYLCSILKEHQSWGSSSLNDTDSMECLIHPSSH